MTATSTTGPGVTLDVVLDRFLAERDSGDIGPLRRCLRKADVATRNSALARLAESLVDPTLDRYLMVPAVLAGANYLNRHLRAREPGKAWISGARRAARRAAFDAMPPAQRAERLLKPYEQTDLPADHPDYIGRALRAAPAAIRDRALTALAEDAAGPRASSARVAAMTTALAEQFLRRPR